TAEARVGRAAAGLLARAAERRARRERLEAAAARAVAGALRAVRVHHDVSELGARPGGAAVHAPAEQQPAADTRAEREHHRVVGATRGARAPLGEDRGVR